MKRSISLKKAQDKYRAAATRTYAFRFNRDTDADVIEMMDLAHNKQDYIRSLIRNDAKERGIKRHGADDRTVTVKLSGKAWKARCQGTTLRSDSFDVLMNKIRDKYGTGYTIVIEDINL